MDETIATDLAELKEWLRVDDTDNDITLKSLISVSRQIIKNSSAVTINDVKTDSDAFTLYRLLQKLIITDLYENRSGSVNISPVMIAYYAQLEAYKLENDNVNSGVNNGN